MFPGLSRTWQAFRFQRALLITFYLSVPLYIIFELFSALLHIPRICAVRYTARVEKNLNAYGCSALIWVTDERGHEGPI